MKTITRTSFGAVDSPRYDFLTRSTERLHNDLAQLDG
jgi:hypothetical protein